MNRYFACFGLPGSLVLTGLMSLLALVLALCFPTPARWLCLAAMLFSSRSRSSSGSKNAEVPSAYRILTDPPPSSIIIKTPGFPLFCPKKLFLCR